MRRTTVPAGVKRPRNPIAALLGVVPGDGVVRFAVDGIEYELRPAAGDLAERLRRVAGDGASLTLYYRSHRERAFRVARFFVADGVEDAELVLRQVRSRLRLVGR